MANNDIMFIQDTLAKAFDLAPMGGEDWQAAVARAINQLIEKDFSGLVNILYRLDVNEQKVREVLRNNPGSDAGALIAGLVIERLLEKCKTRKNHPPTGNIPDDEKW